MTLEERIEAAAIARDSHPWSLDKNPNLSDEQRRTKEINKALARRKARDVLQAAFPELFGPSPSHWLAPIVADEGMVKAAPARTIRIEHAYGTGHHLNSPALGSSPQSDYAAMRDNYLNRK